MDISTVIFAILAIFVVWKLRSVLGTRTGAERPPTNPFARRDPKDPGAKSPLDAAAPSNVIPLPGAVERVAAPLQDVPGVEDRWEGIAATGSAVAAGLDQIVRADPSFAARSFLEGARAAYEVIILAFAKGDRGVLAPLLAKDVFDSFSSAIAAREAKGDTVETTFVGVGNAVIQDAQLRGKTEQIAVRFDTKLTTLTRDKAGAVIDGSPDRVSEIVDLWTFARDVTSRDPNWRLVATETGQ